MDKLNERAMLVNWVVVAAGIVVGWGVLLTFGKSLPPEVPLFYTRPWGQDQLVKPVFLNLVPVMTLIIGGLTVLWGRILNKDRVLSAMVVFSGIATQIILSLGLLRIIFLVI